MTMLAFSEDMESVQQQLEGLGLSQNEVKVYMASLEIGPATAQQLAAKAAVVRPTAYVAIGGLVKRGLIGSHTRGKKQYFQAERPNHLLRLVEEEKKNIAERESRLKSLLPGLESLVALAGEKPEVKYYEGVPGLQSMQQVLYESKSKTIDILGNPIGLFQLVPEKIMDFHIGKMRKLGIQGRGIYIGDGKLKDYFVADKKSWKYKNWKKSIPHVNSEIAVFDAYVAFVTYEPQLRGIMMKSKAGAALVKILFQTAWETL